MKKKYALFISGPTASGKTDLSLALAKKISDDLGITSQIINADIGQFYKPLSVGTAKPDWENMPYQHHLFDVLDEPKDLNVVTYRSMILELIEKIWKKGDLPIVVGGSLFYIRSIFFPPMEGDETSKEIVPSEDITPEERIELWEKLKNIDPKRADDIHPQDVYRVRRALAVWERTGQKPSEQEPGCEFPFSSRILFVNLDREELYNRINLRTEQMISGHETAGGWIEEAKSLKNGPWEQFLKRKKLIGYPEIFEWLESEKRDEIPELIRLIQQKTRNYAKRQITFWKKFRTLIEDCQTGHHWCKTETIGKVDNKEITEIIEHIQRDLDSLN